MHEDEDQEKVPFHRLEPAVLKFTKVAIPTDLERLKQHLININKFQQNNLWDLLQREYINAGRTVQQLRGNMQEMEKLCFKIRKEDYTILTKTINPVKEMTTAALTFFGDLKSEDLQRQSHKDFENVACFNETDDQGFQLCSPYQDPFQNQNAVLSTLEKDLWEVNKVINEFSHLVYAQQEKIDSIEDHVNTSTVNLEEGTKNLGKAVKYKLAILPAAGAIVGGVIGGPLGLLAGFKMAGLAAALGGGVLGFTGGRLIQRRKISEEKQSSENANSQKKTL